MNERQTTEQKALEINLDAGFYGTFAEIGAGQEVGRWFFRAGGAAGTVAKTISAYDKKVSDSVYGTAQRYVSSGRLMAMLEHEYSQNIERLDADRGAETAFFAFADTVSAQNYRGDADCHGWMGIRFQAHPRAAASQIILHGRMLDRDALAQHEALGILGVNLLHGTRHQADDPEALLRGLLHNLDRRRIEIGMAEFSGEAFANVDHRVISLWLVELGLCDAAMFSASGEVLRPSESLYKRPVVLQAGRFRPPTRVDSDVQLRASERFAKDPEVDSDRIVSLLQISLDSLRRDGKVEIADFLDCVQALTAVSQSVLVTTYQEHHQVAQYLQGYSASQIAIPIGIVDFMALLHESRFAHLPGGLLEATGRLFSLNTRIYVYPGLDPVSQQRLELDTMDVDPSVARLFEFLRERGVIQSIEGLPDAELRFQSDDVLSLIQTGDPAWKEHVEPEIAEAIKSKGLFGYGAST
jgi:hypothetical protein